MSGLNNVSDIFISVNLENKNTLTVMTAFLFLIFCLLPSLLNLVCHWAMILVLSCCIFFNILVHHWSYYANRPYDFLPFYNSFSVIYRHQLLLLPLMFPVLFTQALCVYCRVSLPFSTMGVNLKSTTSSITVNAKLGITAIWNLDDSLDVWGTPLH